MIKNEKQYKIARKKVSEINGKIEQLTGGHSSAPPKDQLILVSLHNMKSEMQADITAYEHLKTGQTDTPGERNVSDLPALIIEHRIVSGLTQKEFAKKLGIKEQQLQRYEAENFTSISFRNLLKTLDLLGIDVHIKKMRINRSYKRQSGRNESMT